MRRGRAVYDTIIIIIIIIIITIIIIIIIIAVTRGEKKNYACEDSQIGPARPSGIGRLITM
jgi:NADH:ubiquinone oxidoreductase subunit H